MSDYPKIAQLKTVEAFRARLAELGLELPVDDAVLTAAEGSPLASRCDWAADRRQSLVHSSDGGLGCESRWVAERAYAAPVAEFWPERGEADLGRRGGGGAARWPGESESDVGDAEEQAGLAALLTECAGSASRGVWHDGRFVRRPATDALGPILPAESKKLEPRIAYHHPLLDAKFGIDPDDDSVVWTDDELERLIDAMWRRRGWPRGRLSVRRYQSVSWLSAARVFECAYAAGKVRRRFGGADAGVAHDHSPRARDVSRFARAGAAERV